MYLLRYVRHVNYVYLCVNMFCTVGGKIIIPNMTEKGFMITLFVGCKQGGPTQNMNKTDILVWPGRWWPKELWASIIHGHISSLWDLVQGLPAHGIWWIWPCFSRLKRGLNTPRFCEKCFWICSSKCWKTPRRASWELFYLVLGALIWQAGCQFAQVDTLKPRIGR